MLSAYETLQMGIHDVYESKNASSGVRITKQLQLQIQHNSNNINLNYFCSDKKECCKMRLGGYFQTSQFTLMWKKMAVFSILSYLWTSQYCFYYPNFNFTEYFKAKIIFFNIIDIIKMGKNIIKSLMFGSLSSMWDSNFRYTKSKNPKKKCATY